MRLLEIKRLTTQTIIIILFYVFFDAYVAKELLTFLTVSRIN